jgi:hypothetical protein
MSQSPVRPPEPLIAPAVEARIREIIRDELHRHIITTEVTIEIAPTTVQIDGATIAAIIYPHISRRIDDDLSAGLSAMTPPKG